MPAAAVELDDPRWEAWADRALAGLTERNRALDLGRYPTYGVDYATGRVSFGAAGRVAIRFRGQFTGTTDGRSWLWAWANPAWDAPVLEAAKQARELGEARGIHPLVHPNARADDLEALAWRFTAAVAEITSAAGAYRTSAEPGSPHWLYMVLTDPEIVEPS